MGIPCRSFNFIPLRNILEYYFLGDEELAIAFRFAGVQGTAVRDAEDALVFFNKITEGSKGNAFENSLAEAENCFVLIITEEVALWLGDILVEWQLSGLYPLIVEIPGITGRLEGRKTLVDLIREAIGIHV